MNDTIVNDRVNKLEEVKQYVSKKIVWENFMKNNDMKSVYNKKCYYNIKMNKYNETDLIQELSFKYYEADTARERERKKNKKLQKENEKLLEKIKILEDNKCRELKQENSV
jgi:hypothetical protein